jgi:hypothetical protein
MQCAYIDSTGQSIKTRGPIAGPHYNTTPHCRPLLQDDAPFQTLTTTRHPISGPHYNTTPHCRPSLQHDAPFQVLTITRRFLAGPHYNTTPRCRPSLQQDAPLRPSLQHDAPLQALTTTWRPITGPRYNTTPHSRPSQQYVGKHEPTVTVSSSRLHRSARICCGPLSFPRGRLPEWTVPLNDQAVTDFFSSVVGWARWDCRLYWNILNVASTVRYVTTTRYTALRTVFWCILYWSENPTSAVRPSS